MTNKGPVWGIFLEVFLVCVLAYASVIHKYTLTRTKIKRKCCVFRKKVASRVVFVGESCASHVGTVAGIKINMYVLCV